ERFVSMQGSVSSAQACTPFAFGDQAGVIEALVLAFELGNVTQRILRADPSAKVGELVTDRQDQSPQVLLVVRVYGENIEADALGEFRVIEQAVLFSLFNGLRYGLPGNSFQFESLFVTHGSTPLGFA